MVRKKCITIWIVPMCTIKPDWQLNRKVFRSPDLKNYGVKLDVRRLGLKLRKYSGVEVKAEPRKVARLISRGFRAWVSASEIFVLRT